MTTLNRCCVCLFLDFLFQICWKVQTKPSSYSKTKTKCMLLKKIRFKVVQQYECGSGGDIYLRISLDWMTPHLIPPRSETSVLSPHKIDVIPMIFQLVQYLPKKIGSDIPLPPKIGEIVKLSLIEKSLCTYVQHRFSLCCPPTKILLSFFFSNWIRMR